MRKDRKGFHFNYSIKTFKMYINNENKSSMSMEGLKAPDPPFPILLHAWSKFKCTSS